MKSSRAQIIAAYAAVARPITLPHMKDRRTCVASTWITIETLKHFGIVARPLAVRATVKNKIYADALLGWHAQHPTATIPEEVVLEWLAHGAAEVAVGYGSDGPDTPTSWNGHLVAWIASRGIAVDASFDQFERPHKGLAPLPGVAVWHLGRSFPTSGRVMACRVAGGAVLGVLPLTPDPGEWATAPDWVKGEARLRGLVGTTVEAVKRKLSGALARQMTAL